MPTKPLPAEDLAHVLTHARPAFETFRNANIFITGGTGFFGHWLLESLLYANQELALNVRITVLTRNAEAFRTKSPHITSDPAVTILEGDIQTFPFPPETHTHIVHAATDSGGQQTARTAEDLYTDILAGTQRVLDFAQHTHATHLLYTSTGAVYGRSTTLLHTPETYLNTQHPQLPPYSYEAAKRASEELCLTHLDLSPVIARCFAFVGPHLPLDAHFAIGNFIGAALHDQPIHIKGDGNPRRSWLYMADLAVWLWTLLAQGKPYRAYNVGSDEGMTIAEAAHLVQSVLAKPKTPVILGEGAGLHPAPLSKDPETVDATHTLQTFSTTLSTVQIDGTPNPTAPLNSYVPNISRAQHELNLHVLIPLYDSIRRTAAWHRQLNT